MNWKRGLTRTYVAAWITFVAIGFVFVWLAHSDAIKRQRTVNEFLTRHDGTILIEDLKGRSEEELSKLAELIAAASDSAWSESLEGQRALRDFEQDENGTSVLLEVRSAAQDNNTLRDTWIAWIGLCFILPGIILLMLRWVTSGFTAK